MKRTKYIFYMLILSLVSSLNSQNIQLISKEDVLSKVKSNNMSLKISDEAYKLSQADYKMSRAVFLPSISVLYTGIVTTNPLMTFGSKLNQEILTAADFNPVLLNDPGRITDFSTKIEIQQPIINVDGFYKRKAAKIKMEAVSLQKKRTQEYLNFEVEKAYMQLQLAYKAVDVLKKAVNTAEANSVMANNVFKQGYLQKADVLAVDVRVTEVKNQLHMAKSNVKNVSNYLSFLMHDDLSIILKPADSLKLSLIDNKSVGMVNDSRADIKAMTIASKAYETMHKADKMTFLPRLNAFGSYELHDDKFFQADANGYLIGAQLSWDIFNGSKRYGKLQQSKANFDKAKLELEQYKSKSNLEFNKTNRMIEDAINKLELTKLALAQSKETLRIRTNRLKQGLEKTTEILIAETKYAQKQLEYYQTIFEYNYAQAYLKFLTN
jgi:outer membrane protein TolC